MQIAPVIQKDFYKSGHPRMFPDNTSETYNNLTPRSSRIKSIDKVVVFNIQYFLKEYLHKQWKEEFFNKPKQEVIAKYKRITDNCLGKDSVPMNHIEKLHDLQYLPLKIKALPEGSLCPIGIPVLTYRSTHPDGYFLPGLLETILSTTLWAPITVATIAKEYKRILDKYAMLTVGNTDFVKFQGHDFSMRGMSSLETATTCGAGHLLSFVGTDTIPAIQFLEDYYDANIEQELVGCSVPATEHAVMCMGSKKGELETIDRLLDLYPEGILSIVLDTWDLTKIVKPDVDGTLMKLRDKILARNGKVVIRPDSTPEGVSIWDLLYGNKNKQLSNREKEAYYPEFYNKGLMQCLYEIFGGTVNNKGFIELNPKCGVIYGDGLGLHNIETIMQTSMESGFASTNLVCGFGSYGYQMISRDTFGFAIKCTYGVVNGESRNIYKDPITDDGTKRSLKGMLAVIDNQGGSEMYEGDRYTVKQECTPGEEEQGLLQTIYEDGRFYNQTTLTEIRKRLNN